MSISTTPIASLPDTVTTRDNLRLALHHWPLPEGVAPRGVVCLVHGMGEHMGRYAHVARHLNDWGWAVVGHDHRGHGRSEGRRGQLRRSDDLLVDLAEVIDMLRGAYPSQRLLMIGHSMGGLVAARFVAGLTQPREAADWVRPVDALVLSSPALDLYLSTAQRALLATAGRLAPDLGVHNGLDPRWVCNDPAVVQAYRDDPLVHHRATPRLTQFLVDAGRRVLECAPRWPVPTLLLYAGADRCVRPAGSARFAALAAQRRIKVHTYPRMAHEIFNEPDQAQVFADLARWLDTL